MKMEEMKAYFEKRGFEVEYKYRKDHIRGNGMYDFVITKNDYHHCSTYRWPADQKTFMDKMIKDWEFHWGDECKCMTRGTTEDLRKSMFNGASFATVIIDAKEYPVRLTNVTIDKGLYTGEEARIECEVTDVADYILNDIRNTKDLYKRFNPFAAPKIKNVIHNNPATIVFWSDGTKTVVKCQDDDIYDPEKGLAMAISKKVLGNKGNYCNEIKKWLSEEDRSTLEIVYRYHHFPYLINDLKQKSLKEIENEFAIKKAYEILRNIYLNKKALKVECQEAIEDALANLSEVYGEE